MTLIEDMIWMALHFYNNRNPDKRMRMINIPLYTITIEHMLDSHLIVTIIEMNGVKCENFKI